MPAVREHFIPKYYVDQAIFYHVNEPSLLRLGPDEKLKLDEQVSKIPNSTSTSPKTIIELPTKSYLIVYMKTVEIDVIYNQCLKIKLLNLITLNQFI